MLTERRVPAGELRINVAEGPDNGPPLVLAHSSTRRWQSLRDLIGRLEPRWHILAHDLRGHGASDRASGYRLLDYAPDTEYVVRELAGPGTLLVGHSGGAMSSVVAARSLGDRLRGLVLLDPPLYLLDAGIRSNYVFDYMTNIRDVLDGRRSMQEAFEGWFDPDTRNAIEEATRQTDPRLLDVLLEDRFLEGLDLVDALASVPCPVLMLFGDLEHGAIVRDRDVELFLGHVPRATAQRVPGGSHMFPEDMAELTADLIEQWVATLPA
jgi:pimeloyl-ACP methyl ester carboxylesterase